LNTALILTSNELYGLIVIQKRDISVHMQKLIQEICEKSNDSVEIIATLQEKHLARWDGHTLLVEPLLTLMIEEACNATLLYEPAQDAYALECPNMHLLFTRYQWATDMWRISPCKDKSTLLSSLSDILFQ